MAKEKLIIKLYYQLTELVNISGGGGLWGSLYVFELGKKSKKKNNNFTTTKINSRRIKIISLITFALPFDDLEKAFSKPGQ